MTSYKVLIYDNTYTEMRVTASITGFLQPQTKPSRSPKRSSTTTSRRCGSQVRARLPFTSSTYVGGPTRSSCRSIRTIQKWHSHQAYNRVHFTFACRGA
jgi:hypothetical protein